MKIVDCYPLITTPELARSRDFYVTHFAMNVVFEASWVVMLGRGNGQQICLGLMAEDHPTHPPDQRTFDGRGVLITIQVTDAAQACDRLKACGVPIVYDLKDEAWGQRRFVTRDPGGALNLVDVVQQTEPQPGYWERYLPR
jgi:catechol 2,3-dioxygenase-like lactoylglutathione lyase family enzyme